MQAAEHPASALLDQAWLHAQLELAQRFYGRAPERVLGTVWWYSASSVLLGQPLQALLAGAPVDPSLDALTMRMLPDGRLVGAYSRSRLEGGLPEFGRRLGAMLAASTQSVAAASGAREPALWAIATDSLASQMLFSGGPESAQRCAEAVADAVGQRLPRPRFATVGPHVVVRRASCCLIDRTPIGTTCASCPNQQPGERERRIRDLMG